MNIVHHSVYSINNNIQPNFNKRWKIIHEGEARPTKGHRHPHVTSSLVRCNGNLTRARFESWAGLAGTVSVQYNTSNDEQSLGVADAIEASDMILVILRDDHRHTSFGHHGYDRRKVKKSVCGTYAVEGNSQTFIQERGTASIPARDGERSEVPNE